MQAIKTWRSGVLSVAALVGVAGGCGEQNARDDVQQASAALAVVEPRLPSSTVGLTPDADGFTAAMPGFYASAPAVAARAFRVEVGGSVREFAIMGVNVAESRAVQYSANTVLYPATDLGASTAVTVAPQDDETVIEATTVIHEPAAPEEYRFAMTLSPGERIEVVEDNSIAIIDETGNPTGVIEAPWAVDAAGANVPFGLSVDGTEVVMTVHHREGRFTYPVVADPALRFNCGIVTCSMYFSRSVTRRMKTQSGVVATMSITCSKAPNPVIEGVCIGLSVTATIVALKAGECASKDQCLRVRMTLSPVPAVVGLYCSKSKYCSK